VAGSAARQRLCPQGSWPGQGKLSQPLVLYTALVRVRAPGVRVHPLLPRAAARAHVIIAAVSTVARPCAVDRRVCFGAECEACPWRRLLREQGACTSCMPSLIKPGRGARGVVSVWNRPDTCSG
jgi:hypothetical protein